MARLILIYGQPGTGKSFSLKSLNPAETIILDADNKQALPWRGWKNSYSADKKNFIPMSSLDKIYTSILKIANTDEYRHIKNLVIDGFGNAMTYESFFYDDIHKTANKFEKWEQVAKKSARIIARAKDCRADLNVIFTAHVDTADPYSDGDVDKLFTPGQMLKKSFKIESHFMYVFYSKADGKNYFFETNANRSTARSPQDCFEPIIPNDLQMIIDTIKHYEAGDE